jgi:hypothetical protein
MGVEQAIARALADERSQAMATRWTDALSSSGSVRSWDGVRFGRRLVDTRTVTVASSAATAFVQIERIGGDTGWYAFNWLWRVRGFLDLLFGGVGMRRGRPSPSTLRVGDTVDFWRVEAIVPDRLLRLAAQMKLPGRAWLEFEVTSSGSSSTIRQTATFDPVGLLGRAYWYALYPVHQLVFRGMLRGIAQAALGQKPAVSGAR